MKLLLTSDGLTSKKIRKEFIKLLDKAPSENKVLIIHTAKLRRDFGYIKEIKRTLIKLGIKKEYIIELDINKKINTKKYRNFDIFYSCGGNTFYILDRVKKTGFDKVIKNFIRKNRLYIGVSAGSIIVHKTIEIAGWGKEGDKNEINLKNLRGLNIIDIAIFPHYKKRLAVEVKEFRKRGDYPIITIRDKEAIIIKNKKIKIIRK